MSEDTNKSNLCPSCFGMAEDYCTCALADGLSISIQFMSINSTSTQSHVSLSQDFHMKNFFEDNTYEGIPTEIIYENQPLIGQDQMEIVITQPTLQKKEVPKKANRSAIKDNINHKLLTKRIQDCYRKVTNQKVPQQIKKYYYKEDYLFRILTLLERKGLFFEFKPYFDKSMSQLRIRFENQLKNETDRLNHLKDLIRRYEIAYGLIIKGNIIESMKVVYNYEEMRQRKNFYKAVKQINEMRKEMGLPFEE